MVETYSQAASGALAENQQSPQTLIDVADSVAVSPGDIQGNMMSRAPFLCKMQDGSQQWMIFDEYRSRPGGPLFLLRYP